MRFTEETMKAHRAKWFVYAGSEKTPHSATMRGQWGYDVECSCGWKTHTGGATKRYVAEELWDHRHAAETSDPTWGGRTFGDLTPVERLTVAKLAMTQLGAELQANAESIGVALK